MGDEGPSCTSLATTYKIPEQSIMEAYTQNTQAWKI